MHALTDEATSWVTIAEAAARSQVTPFAIRSRIKRGNLRTRKDNRGRVLVAVPAASDRVHDLTNQCTSDLASDRTHDRNGHAELGTARPGRGRAGRIDSSTCPASWRRLRPWSPISDATAKLCGLQSIASPPSSLMPAAAGSSACSWPCGDRREYAAGGCRARELLRLQGPVGRP